MLTIQNFECVDDWPWYRDSKMNQRSKTPIKSVDCAKWIDDRKLTTKVLLSFKFSRKKHTHFQLLTWFTTSRLMAPTFFACAETLVVAITIESTHLKLFYYFQQCVVLFARFFFCFFFLSFQLDFLWEIHYRTHFECFNRNYIVFCVLCSYFLWLHIVVLL